MAYRRLDPLALFTAGVAYDLGRLDDIARTLHDESVQGLAPLIAMPMLQSSRRAWPTLVPDDWERAYCPICGAWPSLAEVRGLAASRHLRC